MLNIIKRLTLLFIILVLTIGMLPSCKDSAPETAEEEIAVEEPEPYDSGLNFESGLYDETYLTTQPLPDPEDFVGPPTLGESNSKKSIHRSDWSPRTKSPWICVARANNPDMRIRIAYAMTQAVELDNVDYSIDKDKRVTLYEEAEKVNFDLTQVNADCYTTCSSVASVCLRAAGYSEEVAPKLVYSDSNSPKTNLRKHLKESGLFTCYETPEYTADSALLEPGDILFTKHHTAVVIMSENKINLD